MARRMVIALTLLAVMALSACVRAEPLVGTWQQTGVVTDDGTERSVPASEAVVLELRRGGKAAVTSSDGAGKGTAFTWKLDDGKLDLSDHPGWAVRTVFELDYELDGDLLTMQWIDGGRKRVFEKR